MFRKRSIFGPLRSFITFFLFPSFSLLEEEEFQSKMLGGVKELKEHNKEIEAKQSELVTNFENLDKETKKAFEDFTKAKNELNSLSDITKKLQRVQLQMSHEKRMAYGDPVKRMFANEENKARVNAAIRMAVTGQNGDYTKAATEILVRALGEDSTPGSNIINDQLSKEIYDTLPTYGIFSTFAVRNLGTKNTKMIVNTARPVANYVLTEGGTVGDDSTKANALVTATAEMIAVLSNISIQLLEDAEYDIAEEVMREFLEAYAYRLDWSALQADGTADATDGGMTGVFSGGTAAVAASGNVTTETTDLEDWTKCLLTVDPVVLNRPSKWWMHPQILVRSLAVKDLNGRPIFQTALEAPSAGNIGSILGYPVVPSFAAPVANTTDDPIAVFGDPAGQVIGIRSDYKFEGSDHHKWNALQRSYRGYGRACNKIRKATSFAVLTLAGS